MAYLTEPVPERGVALDVIPGVRRVVADNPGPMTYHGTNTYLIDTDDGLLVLDPGPDDQAHVDAVVRAADGRAAGVLLSHGHSDHARGRDGWPGGSGCRSGATPASPRRAPPSTGRSTRAT